MTPAPEQVMLRGRSPRALIVVRSERQHVPRDRVLGGGFGFLRRPLGPEGRVGVGTTAPAAFYAVRGNGGSSALRCSAADGALYHFREARNTALLVAGKSFRADLDAIDEGTVLVQPLEGLGGWCPRFVKIDFVVLRQHALLFCA
jgi:hypothetical protein